MNQDAYLGDVNTPPSLHRYLYAYGNPTVYTDPSGNCVWDLCVAEIALGAALAGAITWEASVIHDEVTKGQDFLEAASDTKHLLRGAAVSGAVLLGGAAATGVKATIQTVKAIGARQTAYAAANAVVGNLATANTVGLEVAETVAAVASGAAIAGTGMVAAERAAARAVVKEGEAVSEAANMGQAAKSVLTHEGKNLDVESVPVTVKGSARAEASVGAKVEVQGGSQGAKGESSQEIYNNLPNRLQRKTVATDGDTQTLSGYSSNKPIQFTHVDSSKVIERSKEIGHELRPAGALDQGVVGQFSASHAEKQLMVKNPEAKVIDVSRNMCTDCQRFFSLESQQQNRPITVIDPEVSRVFFPDGTVISNPIVK